MGPVGIRSQRARSASSTRQFQSLYFPPKVKRARALPLPPRTMTVEFSHEDYLRLSAHARREGKTRNAVVKGWIRPKLDELPPAEFEPDPDEPDA